MIIFLRDRHPLGEGDGLTVDLLSDMGYGVHLAHPRGNDWGKRRVKNDERDARDLADLLRLGRLADPLPSAARSTMSIPSNMTVPSPSAILHPYRASPLCSSTFVVMSTLAPGKRSEKPLIRSKMASRPVKRPRGSTISQSSVNAS